MARPLPPLRGALIAIAIMAQLCVFLLGTPQLAAAATCAAGAPVTPPGAPPPPGVLPVLPQSGGGGAADFCMRDPAACQKGGPAPSFSSAPASAYASEASPAGTLAFVGSAPGRGHGTLLMLSLPAPLTACGPGTPAVPGAPADPGAMAAPLPVPCPLPPPAPTIDGRAVAQSLAIPWPAMQIGINPAKRGLAGLPTRFWVSGYDGAPLEVSTHVHKDGIPGPPGCRSGPSADLDVTARAVLAGYRWDFGDALSSSRLATTDPGRPYPQVSSIQHAYMLASAAGFPVTLIAHFTLSYQAGSDWQALGSADRTVSESYVVQQAVPIVVNQQQGQGGA